MKGECTVQKSPGHHFLQLASRLASLKPKGKNGAERISPASSQLIFKKFLSSLSCYIFVLFQQKVDELFTLIQTQNLRDKYNKKLILSGCCK